jgi:hypothetical protein
MEKCRKRLNINGEVLYTGTVECSNTTELRSLGKLYEIGGKWENERRNLAPGVQEGTVKPLQVIGVGTTVNNISQLHNAEKSTNIHINTEGKHEELLACIQHDQTAVRDCLQSRNSKLNDQIQFEFFFPINLYLHSVTDGPSFGYRRVYLILRPAPDPEG